MRATWITGIVPFIVGTSLVAQDIPADRPKPGKVSGLVIDAKSGEPVRKAVVILQNGKEPKGIGTTTDPTGKFVLEDVEPGSYIARVERDGYVPAKESLRRAVTVQAGETTTDVQLKMLPTGTITGRVFDPDGDPVSGASVQLSLVRKNANNVQGGPEVSTNDRGEYRAFHLAPGDYRISASFRTNRGRPDQDIRMQSSASSPRGGLFAYPPVYYPGSLNVRQAAPVTVEPGSEMQGIDIHLIRQHAVSMRGQITVQGSAPFTFITLTPIGQEQGQTLNTLVRDPTGKFELAGVLPGTYSLNATSTDVERESRLTGRRTITVGESDLEDIQLVVGPVKRLSGRILVPENRKPPAGFFVNMMSREPGDYQGGGFAVVKADGTFTMSEISSGAYSVVLGTNGQNAAANASDLYVSSIRLGDTDGLAEGVSVGDGPLASLDIVLKANGGTLVAVVKDEKGEAFPETTVSLVPDPPRERQLALYGDCHTDAAGSCRILGITPGEYHAFAFPADTGFDHRDLDAMKPFEKYGKAVKFAEDDKQTIQLTAARVE